MRGLGLLSLALPSYSWIKLLPVRSAQDSSSLITLGAAHSTLQKQGYSGASPAACSYRHSGWQRVKRRVHGCKGCKFKVKISKLQVQS